MRRIIVLCCVLFLLAGCGVYNSRNLIRVRGNSMDFSYGLIACKQVNEVVLLRETNAGKGESKYSIPDLGQYDCVSINEDIKEQVEEEIKLENEEPEDNRSTEDNG